MISNLISDFSSVFGTKELTRTFFSPGRVNLIGEHTDYNGGFVFPCALTMGTYAVVKKREDKTFRMYSKNFENLGIIEFNLDILVNDKKDDWANYPKSVIKTFLNADFTIDTGFDVLFFGNIPNGSGLSSSASIELLTAEILKKLFNLNIDMVEMVKLCQKAENEFIGVKCGIMDQFAIGMGKKDSAILLDCNTLDYTYTPIVLEKHDLIIANTNKKRGLADSKYNERRASCEAALKDLQDAGIDIKNICDLSLARFEELKELIKNDENRTRAKHAVSENERTKIAVEKLNKGDIIGFGKLMDESHISLRDDYEVTGFELDSLVSSAWDTKGTVGARMTGAGFGGCTVNLVEKTESENFIKEVGEKYNKLTGLNADFYVVSIGDGTREIKG